MDGGRRHIDNGEAMAHNRRVEQAREAEHQLIRLSGFEW